MIRLDNSPREYLEAIEQDSSWLPWLSRRTSLRQLRALWRELLALRNRLDSLEERMATDRDLLAVIASGLAAVGPAVDSLIADRDSWKSRALAAEGSEATDEADDTAAAQPIKAALDALTEKLAPFQQTSPPPAVTDVPTDVASVDQPSSDGETNTPEPTA